MLKSINEEHVVEDGYKSDDFFDVPHMIRKSSSVGSMPRKWLFADLEKQQKKVCKTSIVMPNEKIQDKEEKSNKLLYINFFMVILTLLCLAMTLMFLMTAAKNFNSSLSKTLSDAMMSDIMEKRRP
uniref:Uncharacterized protein n=1 Tax=Strongyloides papillosus TaxID=174720 RepID=A0A0N5B2G9_STREA